MPRTFAVVAASIAACLATIPARGGAESPWGEHPWGEHPGGENQQGDTLLDAYSLQQWTVEDGLPERRVVGLCQAADGYLWVAMQRHLVRFDGFRFVDAGTPGPDFDDAPAETIRGVSIAGDGTLLVATSAGVRRHGRAGWMPLERGDDAASPDPEPRACTLVDRTGGEWHGDADGITERRHGRESVARNGKAPVNVSTNALAEDVEGIIWAGTDAGLVRLRRRTKGVRVLRAAEHAAGVRAAWITDDGSLWATAEQGGVVRFAAAAPGTIAEPVSFAGEAGRLRFESILVADDGEVWLGTDGASLWHGRPGGPLERVPPPRDGQRLTVISKLAGDPARRLWIGSGAGLLCLDPGAEEPRRAPAAFATGGGVEDILSAADGTLWVARQDEWVLHADAEGSPLGSFRHSGRPCGSSWSLHRDRTGAIWAGGDGRLVRITDEPPTVFNTSNGLPAVAITQIEDTASGVLWLGTRDGLFACDLERLARSAATQQRFLFRRFDPDGPLAHVSCTGRINKPPTAAGPFAGGACFPTSDGVVVLDSDATLTRPTPPPALLERVTVTRRDGSTTSSTAPDLVRVPADASSIMVRYTAIHLAAPEALRFRYRVTSAASPADTSSSVEDWTTVGRDRTIVLRGLPAGGHRVEVRAGIDGKYAEPSAAVILDVEPLFWQRPWFVMAGGGAGAAAVAMTSSGGGTGARSPANSPSSGSGSGSPATSTTTSVRA